MKKKYALNYHTKRKEQKMKPRQKLTSLLIRLLIIASLISACSPATAGTAPAAPPPAAPAKVEAPKAAEPATAPQSGFDLNARVSDFLTTLLDGYFGVKNTDALKALQSDPKPFVIDVRTSQEIAEAGYIDGSVNIPMRDLAKSLAKLPADMNSPIVTYCAVGQRGAIAMATLRLLGYTNVKSLSGGLNAWVKANLPVKK
jgi:rhodanese-related sulfurtransferase